MSDSIIQSIEGAKITVIDEKIKKRTFDLSEIFDIDEMNLTTDYATQASMFAYFSSLLASAEKRASDAKILIDVEYAVCDEHYRKELNISGEKYTEAVVRSNVIQDDDYSAAVLISVDRNYDVGILKAIVNALRMRADMLVSLGAHLRQEMGMTNMTMQQRGMDKTVDDVKSKLRERKKS